ncbi:hypothetical protein A1F97_07287 [Pyrenophora tritici-repentis]|nr:hypothetical protein A1F97_07287 [Pyrenophora tritici-repentis]
MKMIEAPHPMPYLQDTKSAVPEASNRVSASNGVWIAMAQQWYRHLDTINDRKPIRSDLSEDEEYPGFRRFLRQRPYIIRHGTYFQPSEEPTWDFEKPLFPIIMPNGKTGPYYLIDPPTPPMSPHLPIMLPYDHWRARRVTVS